MMLKRFGVFGGWLMALLVGVLYAQERASPGPVPPVPSVALTTHSFKLGDARRQYTLKKPGQFTLSLFVQQDTCTIHSLTLYGGSDSCVEATGEDWNGDGAIDRWLIWESDEYIWFEDTTGDGMVDSSARPDTVALDHQPMCK